MQIKKIAACVTLSLAAAFSLTASAQDVMPEAMPSRPTAERIIPETAPVASLAAEEAASVARRTNAGNSAFGETLVKNALQYLGTRYSRGSSSPSGFDCSGFTSYVYRQEGVPILRDSRSQFTQGTPIASATDLRKGDLVFFGGSRGSRSVGHVGIVTDVDPESGKFSFVHASSSKGVTVSESSEAYYSRRYMGARRIVEE